MTKIEKAIKAKGYSITIGDDFTEGNKTFQRNGAEIYASILIAKAEDEEDGFICHRYASINEEEAEDYSDDYCLNTKDEVLKFINDCL